MRQYIERVIVPYVERVRAYVSSDKIALVIMDNFSGQTTEPIQNLLEENNILVSLLPPNSTSDLQPMDIAVNKPAKDYIKRCFEDWYGNKIVQQLEESDDQEEEEVFPKPVNLSLPLLKELGAKWLVGMAEYLHEKPLFIVNEFIHSGITAAFDGENQSETLDDDPCRETEVYSDGFDSDDLDSDEDSVC